MIDLHSESGRRWTTAALVGAALLSAAYWGEATLLRFRNAKPDAALLAASAGSASVTESNASAAATTSPEALARLLGAPAKVQAAAAGPADRFKVMGVIAGASGQGAALVAVDGQPPRPYRVGTELAPGFVLKSVSPRELTLVSPDGSVVTNLPLPEPGTAASPANPAAPARGNPDDRTAGPPAVGGGRSNPRGPAASVSPPATSTAPAAAPTSVNTPTTPTAPTPP